MFYCLYGQNMISYSPLINNEQNCRANILLFLLEENNKNKLVRVEVRSYKLQLTIDYLSSLKEIWMTLHF